MTATPLQVQDNAARFARRDRTLTADRLLEDACEQAIGIIRIGREHGDKWAGREARIVLAKAERRASRVLGRQP